MEIDLDEDCNIEYLDDDVIQIPSLNGSGRRYIRISMSGNEIDMVEWDKLWTIASKYERRIMSSFDFYEDGKDRMRVE
jgi:hypothetical protein